MELRTLLLFLDFFSIRLDDAAELEGRGNPPGEGPAEAVEEEPAGAAEGTAETPKGTSEATEPPKPLPPWPWDAEPGRPDVPMDAGEPRNG